MRTPAKACMAFWALFIAAFVAFNAPWAWELWDVKRYIVQWTDLTLLAAMTLVQVVTAHHWRAGRRWRFELTRRRIQRRPVAATSHQAHAATGPVTGHTTTGLTMQPTPHFPGRLTRSSVARPVAPSNEPPPELLPRLILTAGC